MNLSEIASIAGKGGLYHILKPTRGGVIVETLDEQKKKIVVGANYRVSVLKEVSIYTTDSEGSVPLEDIFQKIHDEFGEDPGVDSSSDQDELKAFLKHILPEYDDERVYPSDMKKLVAWYKILYQYAPEVFEKEEGKPAEKEEAQETTETKPTEEAKKKEDQEKA